MQAGRSSPWALAILVRIHCWWNLVCRSETAKSMLSTCCTRRTRRGGGAKRFDQTVCRGNHIPTNLSRCCGGKRGSAAQL